MGCASRCRRSLSDKVLKAREDAPLNTFEHVIQNLGDIENLIISRTTNNFDRYRRGAAKLHIHFRIGREAREGGEPLSRRRNEIGSYIHIEEYCPVLHNAGTHGHDFHSLVPSMNERHISNSVAE